MQAAEAIHTKAGFLFYFSWGILSLIRRVEDSPAQGIIMADLFDIQAQASRLRHREANTNPWAPTLPPLHTIQAAEASLPRPSSPSYLAGHAPEETVRHIVEDIAPALNGQAASSRYYGFVTGGTLPVAEWADNVVSRADQNLHTHLPAQHVATTLEDAALGMVARLLRLGDGVWPGRTFTTGATASNILGLACARESVVARRLAAQDAPSVGELGLLAACARAGVAEIQVLTSAAHSSLSKAASVVGLGRRAVRELPRSEAEPWRLDVDALEAELQRPGVATVIAVSGGEVNTSRFSLADVEEWTRVRRLADRYGAWIHVDGGVYRSLVSQTFLGGRRVEKVLTRFASIWHLRPRPGGQGRVQAAAPAGRGLGSGRQHHGGRTQAPQRGKSHSSIRPTGSLANCPRSA